jgi:hypothetical protein
MTRDDILQLVEEAGFELYMFSSKGRDSFELFASLVAAYERKACAKVLEENAKACVKDSLMYKVLMSNAAAIRARGSEPCPECGGARIILVPNTDVMPCPHCLSNTSTG